MTGSSIYKKKQIPLLSFSLQRTVLMEQSSVRDNIEEEKIKKAFQFSWKAFLYR